MMNSMRMIAIMMLISAAVGCRCFQRNSNPRRDVGRVQQNVGSGQTDIFPRTNTQPYSPATINGPLTTPTSNAQGARLAVAGPPPGTPVFNEGVPAQAAVAGQMIPAPGMVAGPGVMAPPGPVYVAQPAPIAMVQAIPVVFQTPTTRSSFVPAGAVAVAPAGVAIPMATGPAMNPQAMGGFLSDQTPPQGMQLVPRLPQDQQAPIQPQAVPVVPAQPAIRQQPSPGKNSLPLSTPSDRPPISNPAESGPPPVPNLLEGSMLPKSAEESLGTSPPPTTKPPGQTPSKLPPSEGKLETPPPPTDDLKIPDIQLPGADLK